MEEGHVRTESSGVMINLKQQIIVFKIAMPCTAGVRVQRLKESDKDNCQLSVHGLSSHDPSLLHYHSVPLNVGCTVPHCAAANMNA